MDRKEKLMNKKNMCIFALILNILSIVGITALFVHCILRTINESNILTIFLIISGSFSIFILSLTLVKGLRLLSCLNREIKNLNI